MWSISFVDRPRPTPAVACWSADLGVLQLPTLEEAASLTVGLVAAITDDADLMPSLSPEECSPVEASRRAEVSGLILRKRQIARSRSLPQAACLKCGLPLSDPTSVSIGLGPECRKHLSSRDIEDLRSGSPIRKSLIGARSPKQWVRDVSQRYRYLIEPPRRVFFLEGASLPNGSDARSISPERAIEQVFSRSPPPLSPLRSTRRCSRESELRPAHPVSVIDWHPALLSAKGAR